MRPVFAPIETIELEEVVPVVGHERALGALRILGLVPGGQSPKRASLADCLDIALSATQLLGGDGRTISSRSSFTA